MDAAIASGGPRLAPRVAVRMPAGAWRRALPDAVRLARRAAAAALSGAGEAREVCLVLADDATARRLNRQYRGLDRPTNVLSFGGYDRGPGEGVLGDVVLAQETVAAEAAAQGKRLADHMSHLVVHGVLHLLGHDHEAAAARARMERAERAVLRRLGIADPYASGPGR